MGNSTTIDFFVLPGLKAFDGIIGDDTLRELEAVIDRKNNTLHISPNIEIQLQTKKSKQVQHLDTQDNFGLGKLLDKYSSLFEPVNEKTAIETAVKAEIRTTTEDAVYSKSYPYPPHLRTEVNGQISKLLEDGIIRPSRSPYNSPLWIVPKKENSLGEKQYRLVIDFKRLNAITIPDAYPIPDINHTLACLHGNKYFSTVDLTSGFHQIRMLEKDIKKTAFSTPNGKYEFLRLPFGLKNAPAIFQRMINDVLRPLIGICCYVYIDDIIIFGKDIKEHIENVEKVFRLLQKANLKVNLEKSKFFQKEVEFLGYIVSEHGVRADPKKTAAITNIPPPTNLKDLKSFLGIISYYRKFIINCAAIIKPLTNITRGENAQVSANKSKNIKIKLDEHALKAFNDAKLLLTSSEILAYPNFSKPFLLTTDASNSAIGAVLSQEELGRDRPITYLSRSLNKTEENYSTIEKEMLAIIWALDKLRNYLYGAKEIKIITDHQPLTFALSNSNNNAKLKRWKSRIEEYNYTLIYKPGKTNLVADALSRLPPTTATEVINNQVINAMTSSTTQTTHSAEVDSTDLIPFFEVPINVFKNQLIFSEGSVDRYCYEEPHLGYHRHYIRLSKYTKENLITMLKKYLNPNGINGIAIPEKYLMMLQEVYKDNFVKYKLRITQRLVSDVCNDERKFLIIEEEHKRAHRGPEENKKQILEKYYFPQITKLIKKYTKSCPVCAENKYDRHPPKVELQPTPIPTYPAQILHLDILEIKNEKFITCIDKFTKFTKFFHIKNKSVLHVRDKLIKLLHYFSAPEIMVMDNEGSFISPIVQNYIQGLGITIYTVPAQKSEANGAIERVHSTIIEIFRCLKVEFPDYSVKELINIAVDRYNNTVHTVTKKKPVDVFFNRTSRINYQNLINFKEKVNQDLQHEIARNQRNNLNRLNRKRIKPPSYKEGEVIYRKNKQIKSKEKPLYHPEVVSEDNKVTVLTKTNKKIHKSHIKNQ